MAMILSGALLLCQLGALVWSVVLCIKARRARKRVVQMIKELEGYGRADRDARRM